MDDTHIVLLQARLSAGPLHFLTHRVLVLTEGSLVDAAFAPIVLSPNRRLLINISEIFEDPPPGHKLGHLQREAAGAGAIQGGDSSG